MGGGGSTESGLSNSQKGIEKMLFNYLLERPSGQKMQIPVGTKTHPAYKEVDPFDFGLISNGASPLPNVGSKNNPRTQDLAPMNPIYSMLQKSASNMNVGSEQADMFKALKPLLRGDQPMKESTLVNAGRNQVSAPQFKPLGNLSLGNLQGPAQVSLPHYNAMDSLKMPTYQAGPNLQLGNLSGPDMLHMAQQSGGQKLNLGDLQALDPLKMDKIAAPKDFKYNPFNFKPVEAKGSLGDSKNTYNYKPQQINSTMAAEKYTQDWFEKGVANPLMRQYDTAITPRINDAAASAGNTFSTRTQATKANALTDLQMQMAAQLSQAAREDAYSKADQQFQAQQFNSQAGLQNAQFGAGQQLSYDQLNSQKALELAGLNTNASLTAGQMNQTAAQNAAALNSSNYLQTAGLNSQNQLNSYQANLQNALGFGQLNTDRAVSSAQINNQNDQFYSNLNSQNQLQANAQNIQNSLGFGQLNTDRSLGAAQLNNQNNQYYAGLNSSNALSSYNANLQNQLGFANLNSQNALQAGDLNLRNALGMGQLNTDRALGAANFNLQNQLGFGNLNSQNYLQSMGMNLQNQQFNNNLRVNMGNSALDRQLASVGALQQGSMMPYQKMQSLAQIGMPIQAQQQLGADKQLQEAMRNMPENNPWLQMAMQYITRDPNTIVKPDQTGQYASAGAGVATAALMALMM